MCLAALVIPISIWSYRSERAPGDRRVRDDATDPPDAGGDDTGHGHPLDREAATLVRRDAGRVPLDVGPQHRDGGDEVVVAPTSRPRRRGQLYGRRCRG